MFILQCYQTTTVLPNPDLDDSKILLQELDIKRNLAGAKHYYVKAKGGRQKLTFNFTLTRMKALELREFIRSYLDKKIIFVDQFSNCWHGNFTMNPFSFTSVQQDMITVPLEFEGQACAT